MNMLKYTSKDIDKMINAFASISENKENPYKVYNEMIKLIDYPSNVLWEFLHCMGMFEKKDQNYIKDNYQGVISYIILRLNFVS